MSATDSRMALAYHDELTRLTGRSVGQARVDQLQWLAWMQQVCRTNVPDNKTGTIVGCLKPLYDDRVKLLRLSIERHDGVSFYTRSQYLAVAETDAHGSPEFPGFSTMQASWQQADTEDVQWTAWNVAVEARMLSLAGGDRTVAATPSTGTLDWPDDLAQGADTTLLARMKSIEHSRVTTIVNVDGMGHGAAHPFENGESITWLLPQERALQSADVFADMSPWQQAVATASWQQLQKSEQRQYLYAGVTGPDAKALRDVVSNPRNWTLEKDGLHVSYPEYTVAPRVSPPDDAVIPWAMLQPVLRTGFELP